MEDDLLVKIWKKINGMDDKINGIDDRINGIDDRINDMDGKINDLQETFEIFHDNVDQEFKKINKKLDNIESRQYTNKRNIAENTIDIKNLEREIM